MTATRPGRLLRWTGGAVLALIGLAAAFLYAPDTNPDAMRAQYGEGGVFVSAGGMAIHTRASGPESAPVLLMIHGTSASLHTWAPLRSRLDADYRVLAYDQPGHGLTGPHPDRDYTYDGMAEAVDAVLASARTERAVLIGNSMGGWVAWRYALANPDRVAALVLIDPAGMPSGEEVASNLGFRFMRSGLGRTAMRTLTPRAAVEASLRQTTARDEIVTDAMVDRYWHLLRYPGNRQAAGDQFTSDRKDLSGRLGEIDAPTLILWGEEDALIPVSSGAKFAEAMPNARLVTYDGVGHLPMEEVPDAVAADIGRFLREQGID